MGLCTTCHAVLIAAKRSTVRVVAGLTVALFFCVPGSVTQQQLDSEAVINHLNAVIKLYRNASAELQTGGAPTDIIYQENAKSLAADVVRLAFQAARAEAAAIRATEKAGAPNSTSPQSSAQVEARNKARIADVQSKIDDIDKQIASAPRNKRDTLQAQKLALQGELNLDNAVQDVIQKRAAFMESGTDTAAEGLEGRINQLAKSVPGVFAVTNDQKPGTQAKPTPQSEATKQTPSGLVSQALALYAAVTSVHQIDQLNDQTARVRQTANDLRQPLRDALVADIKKGRELTDQATSGQSPPASPQQFQELTDHFKRLSAVVLPLSQEIVTLDLKRAPISWNGEPRFQSARFVFRLAKIDCDFNLPGVWELGRKDVKKESPISWNDSGTLGIVNDAPGGSVDPGKLVSGLARAAQRSGAIIFEHACVENISYQQPLELEVSGKRVGARQVLIATNAESLELSDLSGGAEPKFTLALATAALTDAQLKELGLSTIKPFYTVDMPYLWGRSLHANQLIFGSGLVHLEHWSELLNLNISSGEAAGLMRLLESRVRSLHPALENIRFTNRWGGPILIADQMIPVFRHHLKNKNIIVLGGYSGHGVALSVYLGRWAADVLAGKRKLPLWNKSSGAKH